MIHGWQTLHFFCTCWHTAGMRSANLGLCICAYEVQLCVHLAWPTVTVIVAPVFHPRKCTSLQHKDGNAFVHSFKTREILL